MPQRRSLLLTLSLATYALGATATMVRGHPLGWHAKSEPTAKEQNLTPEQELEKVRQFHGHVGPYAVLGYRLGQHAKQELEARGYFDMRITVHSIPRPPFTCFLDGMQVSTGCTFGKRNMVLVPYAPGSREPLFRVGIQADNGGELSVEVLPDVKATFAQWLSRGDSEEQIYRRLMAMPPAQLWKEETRFAHLFDRMTIVPDVRAVAGHEHSDTGMVRMPLCGQHSTTVHFLLPAETKVSPWAQGGPEHECPTIVTAGKMDLVAPDRHGTLRRRTVSAGALFMWPHGSTEVLGFENPYKEPCEFYCVYVPALPGVTSPEEGVEWLHSGGL